jgi:ribosomal protein L35
MSAKRFKFAGLFICRHKASHGRGRQQRDARRGLRNGYVCDVADLAVLLV